MKWRIIAVMAVLGLLGWWGLVVIQRQFKVGEFAQSPQYVDLLPGSKAIVAGGQGLLSFIDQGRHHAVIEVRCAAERQLAELGESAASEEICGFTVRWLGRSTRPGLASGSQRFEVAWRSETGSEDSTGGREGDF